MVDEPTQPDGTIHPIWTVLERQPEYLRAIGTVAVEIVNMEVMLADLMGSVLRISGREAQAVFFAPQATGPRISMLENAIEESLKPWPKHKAMAANCIERARKYQQRRNDVLHESWGLDAKDGSTVSRSKIPLHQNQKKQVPIIEVYTLVYNIRVLVTNIIHLTELLDADQEFQASPRTQSGQHDDKTEVA